MLLNAINTATRISTRVGCIAAAASFGFVSAGTAQIVRNVIPVETEILQVEGTVENAETVALLSGLAAIERDMMLGMLFLQDGLTSTVGSHFTHPRKETWPGIKDGLAAAGVADFEPLLVTLETETDKEAVTKAFLEVNSVVLEAQAVLQPTEKDRIMALIAGIDAANARFNTGGPTEVTDYQDGWAGLMIERGKVDLLMQSGDPAIAKAAADMALAMDEVILMMPDPAVTEPVAYDPAPVATLLGQLQGMAGSI